MNCLLSRSKTLEQTYIKVWRASHVGDEQGREKKVVFWRSTSSPRSAIISRPIVNDGKLAGGVN